MYLFVGYFPALKFLSKNNFSQENILDLMEIHPSSGSGTAAESRLL